VDCVRALAQSGLNPSNCRLLDPLETVFSGVGDGRHAILVLGFESADHPLDAWLDRALELVRDHGGSYDADAVARSLAAQGGDGHRSGAAGAWRDAFLRMPYWRDPAVGLGLIMDTFETATTWDRFASFYTSIKADVGAAVERATGQEALISCRLTHVYPDGPAPYFTLIARGDAQGSVASALAAWRDIKQAATAAVIHHGGTVTHHHAVGRDHRSGYEREADPLFRRVLAAAKRELDPQRRAQPGRSVRPAGADGGDHGGTGGPTHIECAMNHHRSRRRLLAVPSTFRGHDEFLRKQARPNLLDHTMMRGHGRTHRVNARIDHIPCSLAPNIPAPVFALAQFAAVSFCLRHCRELSPQRYHHLQQRD
jgi:alkyldihydroxyacetonephosphate synthase